MNFKPVVSMILSTFLVLSSVGRINIFAEENKTVVNKNLNVEKASTPMMEQISNEVSNPRTYKENLSLIENKTNSLDDMSEFETPESSRPKFPQSTNSKKIWVEKDIQYSINDDKSTVTIVGYIGTDKELVIPDMIDNKVVTSIDEYAFYYHKNLTSIVLPDSITSIGLESFSGCTELTSINIPDSVTSIDDGAFFSCEKLTSINIPNGITSISNGVFWQCIGLTGIDIPDSVTSIGGDAFRSCTGLTSIEIPNSVTSIGSLAFTNCTGLTSIEIPDSVTSIGENVFSNCTELTSIILPNSITSINRYTFWNCTKLTNIVLPNSVTSIDRYAFRNCTGLTSIVLPNNLTSIGTEAFNNCTGLTSIEIPNSVTFIDWQAFSGCTGLTNVVLPNSITSINSSTFRDCTGLTSIEIPNSVTSIGISAFNGCTELTSIEIPNSVTSIGSSAFRSCTKLTNINIPNGVTSIDDAVFWECIGLTSIEIPDSVTSIDYFAFKGCTGLTNINIPSSVTFINDLAFIDCTGLTSIEIPNSVTFIGESTFDNCPNLVIRCYTNSYAYNYAIENKIPTETISGASMSINVKDTEGKLIHNYSVNWYEKGSDTVIATGNLLNNFDINKQYQYEIILDEVSGVIYKQPPKQDLVIDNEQKAVDVVLEAVESAKLTGRVVDNQQKGIEGADILIKQIINNKFNKTFNAISDVDGNFSINVLNGEADIIISKDKFLDSKLYNSITQDVNLGEIVLYPIKENKVTINLNKQVSIKDGEDTHSYPILSFINIDFTLKNITQDKDITEFKTQYPYILIEDEAVNINDKIEITAKDNTNQMVTTKSTFELDEHLSGTATIDFIENGSFEVDSITSQNTKSFVMIFDSNGNFVNNCTIIGTKFESDKLIKGDYTALFMSKTNLITKISNISKLNDIGLVDGIDYITKAVTIEDGKITTVSSVDIPKLNEEKLYYTKSSSFTANKSTIPVGNLITMRLEYNIDDKYNVDSQTVKIDIPKDMQFLDNSVILDSESTPYSYSENTVSIITNKNSGIIKFCVIPTASGEHITDAFLSFDNDGNTITQPIGQITSNVTSLTLDLPEKTGRTKVTASGISKAHSLVKVFDNDVEVGETESNANGDWKLTFELVKPYSYSYHNIYSETTIFDGIKLKSEAKTLFFNKEATELSKINMIYNGNNIEMDFLNPSRTTFFYTYVPSITSFTFLADFTNNENVENLYILVKNKDEAITKVPMIFNNNSWIGSYKFTLDNLPVSIGAAYSIKDESFEFNVEQLVDSMKITNDSSKLNIVSIEENYDKTKVTCTTENNEKVIYTSSIEYIEAFEDYNNYTKMNVSDGDIYYYNYDIKENSTDFKVALSVKSAKNIFERLDNKDNQLLELIKDKADNSWIIYSLKTDYTLKPEQNSMRNKSVDLENNAYDKIFKELDSGKSIEEISYNKETEDNLKRIVNLKKDMDDLKQNCPLFDEDLFKSLRNLVNIYFKIQYLSNDAKDIADKINSKFNLAQEIFKFCGNSMNLLSKTEFHSEIAITEKQVEQLKYQCSLDDDSNSDSTETGNMNLSPIIDPSGYVYEAVYTNRLSDVVVSIYTENGELWNANEYSQDNPLKTDSEGKYAWDVPIGNYQVKAEKEKYQIAYSDWLPVPPPQTEVNFNMLSTLPPNILSVNAYSDYIEIIFDKYMQIDTVNTDNITIGQNSAVISGNIKAIDAQYSNPNSNIQYAKVFHFIPASYLSDNISIDIKDVVSYAGITLASNFNTIKNVVEKPLSLNVSDYINMKYGTSESLEISVYPPSAGVGKKVLANSSSPLIADLASKEITLDSDGKAIVNINAKLIGETKLEFTLEETPLKAISYVSVNTEDYNQVSKVIASVKSGEINSGTIVSLSTATDGAIIYYTLDGTPPYVDSTSRKLYNGSIIINDNTILKCYAIKEGYKDSEVSTYNYTIAGNAEEKLKKAIDNAKNVYNTSNNLNELIDAMSDLSNSITNYNNTK